MDASELVEDILAEDGDDVLEHFGIKGMKWGVRRSRESKVTAVDRRKKIKTKGGHGLKADPSALRARTIGQKAKASGLKALTDDELKAYANRLNLEQSVKRLQWQDKPATERFIRRLLGQSPTIDTTDANSAAVRKTIKRVATI